jgi:hypothetical protein
MAQVEKSTSNNGKKYLTTEPLKEIVATPENPIDTTKGNVSIDGGNINVTKGNVDIDGGNINVTKGNVDIDGGTINITMKAPAEVFPAINIYDNNNVLRAKITEGHIIKYDEYGNVRCDLNDGDKAWGETSPGIWEIVDDRGGMLVLRSELLNKTIKMDVTGITLFDFGTDTLYTSITTNQTFKDGSGATKTMEITNGIITGIS